MKRQIHFEDNGQDFLSWIIDSNGTVIESNPFQTSIWAGNKVIAPDKLEPGDRVHYISRWTGKAQMIRYQITAIENLK